VVDWRWHPGLPSTPWPILGWPRDLNPGSHELQKHKLLKNPSNSFLCDQEKKKVFREGPAFVHGDFFS
jgi:hypothetical protein